MSVPNSVTIHLVYLGEVDYSWYMSLDKGQPWPAGGSERKSQRVTKDSSWGDHEYLYKISWQSISKLVKPLIKNGNHSHE